MSRYPYWHTHTPISERWHSRYPNYNLYSNDFPTCFRKTWSCGCEAGSIVTSNRGRKMLSRRFWNDVTIPISLYTLYKRGICKTVKVKTFVFIVMLLSRSTVFRTSKPWLHGILHPKCTRFIRTEPCTKFVSIIIIVILKI